MQYILPDGTEYTAQKFLDLSSAVAKSLLHLDLPPLSAVCIIGANSIEWFAADVGASLAAVIPVGVYVTNKPSVIAHIATRSDARVVFVEDEASLQKFLSVRELCPAVIRVVVWGDFQASKYTDLDEFVLSWKDFLELGNKVPQSDLDFRISLPLPESVCKIIFTSGTTGPPKAVMLSHDNIVFTARMLAKVVKPTEADSIVSYLPASHIASNIVDLPCALLNGLKVTLAPADALKGSLVDTLVKTRPTLFLGVPRVYEKIMEKMLIAGAQASRLNRAVAAWARRVGQTTSEMRDNGEDGLPLGYRLARLLVFSTVRTRLGLDRCRLLISGAAPMQKATSQFFRSLDITIHDMYGMSESSGPLVFTYPRPKKDTIGRPVPGLEVRVANADSSGEGELCFRGRNMFVGYKDDDEATARSFDEEGFVKTGDLGKVDKDGFVTITGRAKELIVTAGGENVAPVSVEETLVSAMPAIARAFAIGDKKRFVSAILIPRMDEQGKLVGPAAEVNAELSYAAEALNDSAWLSYVKNGVQKANGEAVSNAAKVKKFELLGRDFSVETGELTPNMKVNRKAVVQMLDDVIRRIYDE